MSVMKRKGVATLGVVLSASLLGVSACSSGGRSSSSSGPSSTAGTPSSNVATAAPSGSGSAGSSSSAAASQVAIDQLYAKAKTEGKVTWYTSMPQSEGSEVAAAFEKAYPGVSVSAVYLSGNTPTTRIETEAKGGLHNADVITGGGDATLLWQAGLIDQSFIAPDAPPPTAGLNMPKGIYADQIQTNVISYNPTALKAAGLAVPTGYEDFTKPEWKGKFSIDPTTADLVDDLGPAQGYDTVLALTKKLGANSPLFVTSHSLSSSQVASGTVVAALSTYGYKAIVYKQKNPATTDFVNPNPLPVGISELGIVKDAPHRSAARLFEDWVVSEAGQKAYVSLHLVSIRNDVGNDPSLWDPSKWKPAFANPTDTTAHINELLSQYRDALGYKGQ